MLMHDPTPVPRIGNIIDFYGNNIKYKTAMVVEVVDDNTSIVRYNENSFWLSHVRNMNYTYALTSFLRCRYFIR